jgi:hypothetical protein
MTSIHDSLLAPLTARTHPVRSSNPHMADGRCADSHAHGAEHCIDAKQCSEGTAKACMVCMYGTTTVHTRLPHTSTLGLVTHGRSLRATMEIVWGRGALLSLPSKPTSMYRTLAPPICKMNQTFYYHICSTQYTSWFRH